MSLKGMATSRNPIKLVLLAIFFTLFISSCASNSRNSLNKYQIGITYNSKPQGAKIYEGGKYLGETPLWLFYTGNENNIKLGKVKTKPIDAIWKSGAKASTHFNLYYKTGQSQQYTFKRPNEHPGVNQDIEHAVDLEMAKRKKQQSSNPGNSFGALLLGSFLQGASQGYLQNKQNQYKAQQKANEQYYQQKKMRDLIRKEIRKTNCTSNVIGSTINTSCY